MRLGIPAAPLSSRSVNAAKSLLTVRLLLAKKGYFILYEMALFFGRDG